MRSFDTRHVSLQGTRHTPSATHHTAPIPVARMKRSGNPGTPCPTLASRRRFLRVHPGFSLRFIRAT